MPPSTNLRAPMEQRRIVDRQSPSAAFQQDSSCLAVAPYCTSAGTVLLSGTSSTIGDMLIWRSSTSIRNLRSCHVCKASIRLQIVMWNIAHCHEHHTVPSSYQNWARLLQKDVSAVCVAKPGQERIIGKIKNNNQATTARWKQNTSSCLVWVALCPSLVLETFLTQRSACSSLPRLLTVGSVTYSGQSAMSLPGTLSL